MGIWNIERVAAQIEKYKVASAREVNNLARWTWEEGMSFNSQKDMMLGEEEEEKLHKILERISLGEPIQYIVGYTWFYGLRLKVNPGVLIPRPETEELVDWILTDHKYSTKTLRVLDIGTGSGCIAITLKQILKARAIVLAIDISGEALTLAEENARHHETDIEFIQRDYLSEGLDGLGTFDIIVSNPPYISKSVTSDEILKGLAYEPAEALFPAGEDPDIFYKKMSSHLKKHLNEEGLIYLEINEFRSGEVQEYFRENNWNQIEIRDDMQGLPRMLKTSLSG